MLGVIRRAFASKLNDAEYRARLLELVPSYGHSLIEDAALCRRVRAETAAVLNIRDVA